MPDENMDQIFSDATESHTYQQALGRFLNDDAEFHKANQKAFLAVCDKYRIPPTPTLGAALEMVAHAHFIASHGHIVDETLASALERQATMVMLKENIATGLPAAGNDRNFPENF